MDSSRLRRVVSGVEMSSLSDRRTISLVPGRLRSAARLCCLIMARVELRDADNRPIPGYALDACEPFRGNAVDHPIRWSAGGDTGSLVGRVVRVHFVLEGAKLFAMRFGRRS